MRFCSLRNTNRLKNVTVYFGLLILASCYSANEEEPARLLATKPPNGAALQPDDEIILVFDKPVTNVKVEGVSSAPVGPLPTKQWRVAAKQLDLIYSDVVQEATLNVHFEHESSTHKTLISFIPLPRPELYITGGNVVDRAKDVDPELLNTAGIVITFHKPIKGGTSLLKLKDGSLLNWIAQWRSYSVTLSPPNGDRLKNGTDYTIEIVGVMDATGTKYDFEIRFTTKE